MRIAFAACLSLLATAPAFAAGFSTIHVGLVVTGNIAFPLVGTWDSRTRGSDTPYHFALSRTSGLFYELVSVPLDGSGVTTMGSVSGIAAVHAVCDLRVTGVITSVEKVSGETIGSFSDRHLKPTYEMRYSIQYAEVVTSPVNLDECKQVAASYVDNASAAETAGTLFLYWAGDGSLIDSAAGTEYARTSR